MLMIMETPFSHPVKGAPCVLAVYLARCGRTLSNTTLSSVKSPALGPGLTAANASVWCVPFCDIVALLLLL